MKVLSFGEILLRLASPGYTKLFQKDSLDATFCRWRGKCCSVAG